ncbi:hypothetical protein MMC30_008299 [Trapelia coarctata]|nr:hypothetical protein [Trapelia coarctata]
MRFPRLGAFALSIAAVNAFQDTSPFILFSTSDIFTSSPGLATASSIHSKLNAELKTCPSDIYVIVSQPGVSSTDYSSKGSTPYLKKWASGEDKSIRSRFTVSEVVGEIDTGVLVEELEQTCGSGTLSIDASTGLFDIVDDMKPRVIKVDFPAFPQGQERSTSARVNDLFLYNLINMLPSTKYTVIYATTPLSPSHNHDAQEPTSLYEMDHTLSPLVHMDLKRDVSVHESASKNSSNSSSLPLFEKYQYFTPGLFMGLLVSFLLAMILYVAVSALGSLQVSYAAFDSMNGPAAHKKQQQQQQQQQ